MNFRNWKPEKRKFPYETMKCPHCGSKNNGFFFEVGYRQDIKSKESVKIKIKNRKTKLMIMKIEKPNIMCILGTNSVAECNSCRNVLSNVNFMLHNKKKNSCASAIRMKRIFHKFV